MNLRVSLIGLAFVTLLALIFLGTTLPAASAPAILSVTPRPKKTPTPPPLVSLDYLHDISLITQKPCGPPCFHGITVGKTTFSDAYFLLENDPAFSHIQSTIWPLPLVASWSTAPGQPCCQMAGDQNTGVVDALLIRLAPDLSVSQLIARYGPPQYVTFFDYSQREVVLGLLFELQGLTARVVPGNANGKLDPTDSVTLALYVDPKDFYRVIDSGTFQAWNGYLPYRVYAEATPIVTPRYAPTPSP